MNKNRDSLDIYLEKTGQTMQELFSGGIRYGHKYIKELVEKALKENKKIVFITELTDGEDLSLGRYKLVPMKILNS